MSRLATFLLLAAIAAACNGTPTKPTQAGSTVPETASSAPTRTIHITGTVTESSGAPVEGARVRWSWPGQATALATTDVHGGYDLVIETTVQFATNSTGISAQKTGYETNWQYASLLESPSQDFRLRPVVNIAAGESIRVEVGPDDSLCGIDDEWRCRRVHVTSPQAGTLTLEVVPDNPAEITGLMTGPPPYDSCCSASNAIVVPAGLEMQVDVLRPWTISSADTLSLSTRFTP